MLLFVEAAGVMSRGQGCGWKRMLPEPRSLSPGLTAQVAGGSEAPKGREWAPGGGSGWAQASAGPWRASFCVALRRVQLGLSH